MAFQKKSFDKNSNISDWYNNIVLAAQLADYAPSKGCMVIRPYGYALWENIQTFLDREIKLHGVKNAYFPLFIPISFLRKEKEHVEGFAPQLAVVTHGGGEKLAEELVVRPTSETVMYEMYKQWTHSWRDLPIEMNQWCNIVRWEKRTMLFMRTTEFLWQEGHCAYLNNEDNLKTMFWALDTYEKTYKEVFALYGIKGKKSQTEKFAGGNETYSFEMLMPNGKALQSCTSHDLGQNFSKAIDWYVLDQKGAKVYPYQNSWGLSTRSIGGLIMVHGDNNGLVLPSNIAPIQIVIVPLPKHDLAIDLAKKLLTDLKSNFRVELDLVEDESAGFKFNKWELKGVPLRLEIGNREAQKNEVTIYRRDTGKKVTLAVGDLTLELPKILASIHQDLYDKHKKYTLENTHNVDTYDEFKKIMAGPRGFLNIHWCQSKECEDQIKFDTKACSRCVPLDAKPESGKCLICGKPSETRWLFGQSY